MNRISVVSLIAVAMMAIASVLTFQISTQLSQSHFVQAGASVPVSDLRPSAPVSTRAYQVRGSTTSKDDNLRLDFNF